ncbi:MAG: hypothetical protein ACI8XV_000119 [Arenicella sp.]|jgi:hypothetical protein
MVKRAIISRLDPCFNLNNVDELRADVGLGLDRRRCMPKINFIWIDFRLVFRPDYVGVPHFEYV